MTNLNLKLKTKSGQHVINNLTTDTPVKLLQNRISELTKIPVNSIQILVGFPPKPLVCSNPDDSLGKSGISNGETLIIEEIQLTETEKAELEKAIKISQDERLAAELASTSHSAGILLKKVVPADNCCLFTSIGYVMSGKIDVESESFMRKIIAEQVNQDKTTYNEGILGRPNDEYCAWILQSDSWGGAIEVSILSAFYGIEFDVVDITNALINRFGEDRKYGMRAFLLYDGIHYDPLYLESLSGESPKTIFPVEDLDVYAQAEQIAQEAKSSRQFTDVNKFTLRCMVCDTCLKGQVEAQQHAKSTGHTNFGEV